ncbi:chaplin [Streptomyces lydicus]|uniref:chaplin n=1 Tax=Streptomyces lydicus TaxID=47763 RepID=UPI00378EC75A
MSRFTRVTAVAALAASAALGGMSPAFADSDAAAGAVGSPGVLSGNVIQIPIHIPLNICGNTINVVGLLNPAFGNTCLNGNTERRLFIRHEEHRQFHHHHRTFKKKHHRRHHEPSGGVHTGGGGLA